MIASWKKDDPPPTRVKPIPIQVIRRIAFIANASNCALAKATSDMIILGFFFLLRPGEYTDSASDTQPFDLRAVQLFLGQHRLSLTTATDADLLAASSGSLTFDRQKNGVRGEVIGLCTSGDPLLCPIRALARRVIHLRSYNASPTTPLARAYLSRTRTRAVSPSIITNTLQTAVALLGADLGFLPSEVSARSLRAAGANALLLARVDTDIIRLIGRWRSDEMLRYLHCQAAPLMSEYARKMLAGGQYTLHPNQLVPMH